jgi:hypothetical protein
MPIKTIILNHFMLVLNFGCVFKYAAKLPESTDTNEKIINACTINKKPKT